MGDRSRYVTTINTAAPGSRETGLGVPLSDIATNTTQNGSNYSKNTALSRIIQGSGPNRGTIATQSSIFTSYNTAFLVDADLGSTAVKNAINDIQVLQDDIGGITTSVENISGAVENMSGVIHNISSIFDEIYDSVKWLSNFNLSQPVIGEIDIDAKLNISGDLNVSGTLNATTLVVSSNVSTYNISVGMLDVTNDINTSYISSNNISTGTINVNSDVTIGGELSIVNINASNISTANMSVGKIEITNINTNNIVVVNDVVIGGTATVPTVNASNVSSDNISGGMLDVSGDVVIGGTATLPTLNASNVSTDNISAGTLDVSGDVVISGTTTLPIVNASNVSVDNVSVGTLDVSGNVVIGGTATLPTVNASNVSTDNVSVGMLDVSGDVVIGGTATLPIVNASNVSTDNVSVGMLDVSGDVVISGTATLPTLNASNVSTDNISVWMLDVSGDVVISGSATLPIVNASNVSVDNVSVGVLDVSGDLTIGGTATVPTLNASNVSVDNVSVGMLDVSGDVVISGTATVPTFNATNITATSIVNTDQITATGLGLFQSTLAVMNPASQTQNFFWAGTAFQLGNLASVDFNIGNDGSNPNKGIIVRGGTNSSVEIPILTADNLSSTLANISTLNVSTINVADISVPDINASQLNASNISVDVNLSVGGTIQTDTLEADTISAGMLDVSGDVVIGGTATLPILNASNVSVDNVSVGVLAVSGDVVIGGTTTLPIVNASNVSTDNVSVGMLDVSGDVVISGTTTLPIVNASNVSVDNISVGTLDVSGDVVIGGTSTIPIVNASNVSTDNISVGMLDVSGDVVIGGTTTVPTVNASNVSTDNISVNNVSVLGDVTIDGTLVCDLTNNLSAGDGIILTSENGKTTITSTATGYGSGPSLAVDANVSSFITSLTLIDSNIDVLWPDPNDPYTGYGDGSNIISARTTQGVNGYVLTSNDSITVNEGDTIVFHLSASHRSTISDGSGSSGRFRYYLIADDDDEPILVGTINNFLMPHQDREITSGSFTYIVPSGGFSFYRSKLDTDRTTTSVDKASATCTIYRKTVPISSTSVTANVPVSDFIETLQIVPSGKNAFPSAGWGIYSDLISVYDYQGGTAYTNTNLFTVNAGDKIVFNWKQSGWVNTSPGQQSYIICYLIAGTNAEPLEGDRIEVGRIYQYIYSQSDHEEISGSFVYNVTSTFSFYRSQMEGAPNLITQADDYGSATATVYRSKVPNSVLVPQLLDATNVSCDNISVTTLECGNVSCDNISATTLECGNVSISQLNASNITVDTDLSVMGRVVLDQIRFRDSANFANTTASLFTYATAMQWYFPDFRFINNGASGITDDYMTFVEATGNVKIPKLVATNATITNDATITRDLQVQRYLDAGKPTFIMLRRTNNTTLVGGPQFAIFNSNTTAQINGEFSTATGTAVIVSTGGWYRVSWGLGFKRVSNTGGDRIAVRGYTMKATAGGSLTFDSSKNVIGSSCYIRRNDQCREGHITGYNFLYIPAGGAVSIRIECMVEGSSGWASSFTGMEQRGSSNLMVEFVSSAAET